MNLNHRKMLALLADALHNREPDAITEAEWDEILREMKVQTVSALPMGYTGALHIPQEQKLSYVMESMKSAARFRTILEEQDRIFGLLEAAGIRSVVLKGAAAAMYYPVPERRAMGDVDLIVLREDFERAYDVLTANGYEAAKTPQNYIRHIVFRTPSGVSLELHNYFSSSPNKQQNEILDHYVYEGIRSAETVELSGHRVRILPKLANGLVLLAHINQHLGTGLGLRQIIDWMCYVEKELDDDFWESSFAAAAESIGMRKLAEASAAMCRKYLGLEGTLRWCACADEALVDEFMEYVLAHGNFGRADSTKTQTVFVMRSFRNPIKGLKVLQRIGLRSWKALDQHPWLKPFAWLYQAFRWISHGIRRGVGIRESIESSTAAVRETEFLNKLGITML